MRLDTRGYKLGSCYRVASGRLLSCRCNNDRVAGVPRRRLGGYSILRSLMRKEVLSADNSKTGDGGLHAL
jgi:hypothetical protein